MSIIPLGIKFIWNKKQAKNYAPVLEPDMERICVMRYYGGTEVALVRNKKTGLFYEASGGVLTPLTYMQETLESIAKDTDFKTDWINTAYCRPGNDSRGET